MRGTAVFGSFQFFGKKLHVTPNDGQRITQIVNKFGRSLAERGEPFLLRQFFEQTIIQFLELGRSMFSCPMNTSAFDIAPDDVPHFARVKRLADVIIGAESHRLFGGFQSAETGQHNDGKMGIDFADFAQTIDAVHAWHANVHDDRVGLFLFKEFHTCLDAVGRVHLIIRLQ